MCCIKILTSCTLCLASEDNDAPSGEFKLTDLVVEPEGTPALLFHHSQRVSSSHLHLQVPIAFDDETTAILHWMFGVLIKNRSSPRELEVPSTSTAVQGHSIQITILITA